MDKRWISFLFAAFFRSWYCLTYTLIFYAKQTQEFIKPLKYFHMKKERTLKDYVHPKEIVVELRPQNSILTASDYGDEGYAGRSMEENDDYYYSL